MPHSHLTRGPKVVHITAFDGTAELARARALSRFELQHFAAVGLSPDEDLLTRRDWLQHLVGLERNPPNVFGYLSVSSWVARQ